MSGGKMRGYSTIVLALTTLAFVGPAQAQSLRYAVDGVGSEIALANAGDINADGVADLAIGTPTFAGSKGLAAVLSGDTGAPIYALSLSGITFENAKFGASIDGLGDIDGDGHGDLIVGSPGETSGNGGVRVYSGATRQFLIPIGRGGSRHRRGAAVAGVPDLNGDSVPDFLFSEPGRTVEGVGAGVVQVLSGADGAGLFLVSPSAGASSLGSRVAIVGDVTGDGLPEIFVVAGGSAFVQAHSGASGDLVYILRGGLEDDDFGASIADVGDLDGDGRPDVMVGAPEAEGSRGSAWLFSGATGALLMVLEGDVYGDRFGSALASLGDLNGDAVPDFVVGARQSRTQSYYDYEYPYVRVFSGADFAPLATIRGEFATREFGGALAVLPHAKQGGRPRLAVGESQGGRALVYEFPPCSDHDGDGYGSPASIDCAYPVEDCDDTNAAVHPGASELCGNGVDDDCDGRLDAGDDGDGDGFEGVCSDCDDGDRDVFPGAAEVCNGVDDDCDDDVDEDFGSVGSACPLTVNGCPADGVLACSTDGTESVCVHRAPFLYELRSDDPTDEFGIPVAGAGDVDGDGYDDIVVGAPGGGINGPGSGSAYVYSGPTGALLHAIHGRRSGDALGYAVSDAGDVNGDARADVLVTAAGDDSNGYGSGAAFVYGGTTGEVIYELRGEVERKLLGYFPTGLGDFDGDGVDDFAVSSQRDPFAGSYAGFARVFSGATGTEVLRIDRAFGDFGNSPPIAGLGDVDGDGFADLAIGSRNESIGGLYSGSVRVISGRSATVSLLLVGEKNDQLGSSVTPIGDVSGDGLPDFAVGGTGRVTGGTSRGLTKIYEGASGNLLRVFESTLPGGGLPVHVAGYTDLDGDAFADLLLVRNPLRRAGELRSIVVVSGATAEPLVSIAPDVAITPWYVSVSWVGDVDGDDISEIVVGMRDETTANAPGGFVRLYSVAPCADADRDGYGVGPITANCGFAAPDCDDADAAVHPDVAEDCANGLDDDCDGRIDGDDGDCPPCLDLDGDGFSTEGGACGPVDCDDAAPDVFPGAAERCNGADDDCDGAVDHDVDADGDGYDALCGGDCDDADPLVSPGAVERCDGVDDDCDGAVDEDFPNVGSACDYEAGSCRVHGRLVCDGVSEVCAPMTVTATTRVVEGTAVDALLGTSIAGVGDLDGDQVSDWVTGVPGASVTGEGAGAVVAVSGATGEVLYRIEGAFPADAFGWSVRDAGDVDRDGVEDLIVGTRRGSGDAGFARIHSGATGALLRVLFVEAAGPTFGLAVAGVGDANGDGVPDQIVGAPAAEGTAAFGGVAWVFSGADGSVLHRFEGTRNNDYLGLAVSGAGDVDEDGFDDFAFGVPGRDSNGIFSGAVFVHSGATGEKLRQFGGESSYDHFGWSLANAGDVDGDDAPDLIAGSHPTDPMTLTYVHVVSPRTGGTLHTARESTAGSGFGATLGTGVDVDGDDRADFLVGSARERAGAMQMAGSARIYSGADGHALTTLFGEAIFDQLGFGLAGLGDTDGNGFAEIVVGAPFADVPGHPNAGRARIVSLGPVRDSDRDGFYDSAASFCDLGPRDCDDHDPDAHPGAGERCTGGVDEDCDGLIDGEDPDCAAVRCVDADGDGYAVVQGRPVRGPVYDGRCGFVDCDDSDPSVHPFAPEVPGDGVDQNCNGSFACDGTGDGIARGASASWLVPFALLAALRVAAHLMRRV